MIKELIFIEGFAMAKGYNTLLRAVHVAKILHEGQTRKNGEPYIIHPTKVTWFLIIIGITNERTLSAAMLHDVEEDCGVTTEQLISEHGINKEIAYDVKAVSKHEGMSTITHFKNIIDRGIHAILVKLGDRSNNVSTMAEAFTIDKIIEYIHETRDHVLPLCKIVSTEYPEYSNQSYVMKEILTGLLNSIEATMKLMLKTDDYSIINV